MKVQNMDDPQKRREYITEYHLQDYMDTDLFSISELYAFEKNESLIRVGSVSNHLFFLVKGKVMVYSYTSEARQLCISYMQHPTLIGEAASFWKLPPNAGVKAVTPCVCVGINLVKYRQTLLNDVHFLQNICRILTNRLNNETYLANSLTESIHMRVARFILHHSRENLFSFQLTTCADILNVSYRHLIRTLSSLCDSKILKRTHAGYLILDRQALAELLIV